ncbi:hypothetical protein IFM89_016413 [Coptis chinensis]|uniref:PRLI-interacting factor A n=1 Tax=Coptis chinensis TaxID=261450 RepID=A0A835HFE6_9MAGN|nr:hypothetical protein IFM89_016413 [Coptis chinensis]
MNDQSSSMMMMNQRNYGGGNGAWSSIPPLPPPIIPSDDPLKFKSNNNPRFMFAPGPVSKPGGGRSNNNWKGKKGVGGGDKRNKGVGISGRGGYEPPTLHELQSQNRMKARRFYPKKKFGGGGGGGGGGGNNNNSNNRFGAFAPLAPRNTTSFLIRAKKQGGIASLVSPCPVTPAVLPTPIFSPSREVLVDMAKEEWGVDGYGSMNGLIRLRSPGNEIQDGRDEDEEEEGGGSSESDVEEHVEVERRLDHDLSRFEMIYPNFADENGNLLEHPMDDQDMHIAQLEEENLTLKERLFLMEREMVDLRMRLQCLETDSRGNKEHKDGSLENEGEGGINKDENMGDGEKEENESVGEKEENNDGEASENEGGGDVCSEKSFCDGD